MTWNGEKEIPTYAVSQVYSQCNFYLLLKYQQLSNKGTLTGPRRTLSLGMVLFSSPLETKQSIFLCWELSLAAPHQLFSPCALVPRSRPKWTGEQEETVWSQCWCHALSVLGQTDAHVYYWHHHLCGLVPPSATQLLFPFSVWHRAAHMCQSKTSGIPWKFRSALGQ